MFTKQLHFYTQTKTLKTFANEKLFFIRKLC